MEHKKKTESLLNMLKICANILSKNQNLGYIETQECFRIMENIIQNLSNNNNISTDQKHIIQKFIEDLDVLHPKFYIKGKNVSFHIKKSWLRFDS